MAFSECTRKGKLWRLTTKTSAPDWLTSLVMIEKWLKNKFKKEIPIFVNKYYTVLSLVYCWVFPINFWNSLWENDVLAHCISYKKLKPNSFFSDLFGYEILQSRLNQTDLLYKYTFNIFVFREDVSKSIKKLLITYKQISLLLWRWSQNINTKCLVEYLHFLNSNLTN